MKDPHRFACVLACCCALAACSSSDDSNDRPAPTGLTCSNTNQCYAGLDAGALRGNAVCLTELQGGYCTHTCTADADCCAIAGECPNGIKEVCSPVQSAEQKYCVLSCESADLPAGADATAFCRERANPNFTCRSTGGGSQNRKFCGP
ncbi:hypothetical protein LVJ94_02190 [Pendulispora rubella]|uniref:Lipoprotein n=1 Tax=Pendulispora rubella TaxID=2741070 RepID=A0ABZ2L806_9BACT